jgi:hypothetical protein
MIIIFLLIFFSPLLAWLFTVALVFRVPKNYSNIRKPLFGVQRPIIVGTPKDQLIALCVSSVGLALAWYFIALFRGWLPDPGPSLINNFLHIIMGTGPIFVGTVMLYEIFKHKKRVYLIPLSAWLVHWQLFLLLFAD